MMDPHGTQLPNFYANYPLRNIPHPHPHDVLCGRGGGTNAHIGNSHWRMLVTANKELYVSLPKKQKMLLSKSIVNAVRSQHPPGRFLQKDSKTNLWYDVGDQRAQEKTSQALREGAPEIRTKIKGDGKRSGDSTDESGDDDSVPSPEPAPSRSQKQSPPPPAAPASAASSVASAGSNAAVPIMHPPPQYVANAPAVHNHAYAPYPHPAPHHMHLHPAAVHAHHMHQQQGPPMHIHHPHMMMHGHPHMPMHAMPPGPPMPMGPPGMPVVPIVVPPPVPPQGPVPERRNKKTQASPSAATQKDKSKNEPRPVVTDSDLPVRSSDAAGPMAPKGGYQDQPHMPEQANAYDLHQPLDLDYQIPPTALDDNGEFSFGSKFSYSSIDMSDFEHAKLVNGGSFGSAMGHARPVPEIAIDPYRGDGRPPLATGMNPPYRQNDRAAADRYLTGIPRSSVRSTTSSDPDSAPPVDGGLEPVGISFGSVGASVMSLGTDAKLEPGGLSFGSMMSYSVRDVPSAVDGGLDAIGASFGSLSLATADRERLVRAVNAELDEEAAAAAAAPTYLQQQRSKGNLLECSDTESDEEDESRQSSARKSADWEKLKATISTQSTVPMSANNPPSFNSRYGAPAATLNIPVTRFDRDFSQMSAISVGDDFESQVMPRAADHPDVAAALEMPPPPPMKKQGSDEWKQEEDLEYAYLTRGNSLAGEFNLEHQYD